MIGNITNELFDLYDSWKEYTQNVKEPNQYGCEFKLIESYEKRSILISKKHENKEKLKIKISTIFSRKQFFQNSS